MTYVTGQLIANGDYNTFATGSSNGVANNTVPNVNTFWGVGQGNKGYGQTTTLSPVTTGTLVTAAQWSGLMNKITASANHQNTAITPITSPVTGNKVAALSALSGDLSSVWNAVGNVASLTNAATGSIALSSANNNQWVSSVVFTITATFSSGNAARYFFNAGGNIQLAFAHSPVTSNAGNTSMQNLAAACGTTAVAMAYAKTTNGGASAGGSGSLVLPVAIGYWQQTASAPGQTIQHQYATGAAPYANFSNILTQVHSNGQQQTNGDVGSVLTFTVTWTQKNDGYGAPTDILDGTTQVVWAAGMPPTTYLANVWGTPTISGVVTSHT